MEDASVEPTVMPLDLLREITDGFSEERKLGSGSFGKVYKGVYQDGEKIAVKMLYDMPGLDDEQFQNEFKNLTRLRHQNIVRLVGYCHDIQQVPVQYEGKLVLAEKTHRALCLEYMSNGSLDKLFSDECDRYNWHTCFRIIKGICHGLQYLHKELEPPIYHLDLKPANVLLDENMVPRIADFGISRLFSDEHTRSTQSLLGTLGYSPPEFIRSRLISNKFDIFSLGVVIIKMMAGCVGYYNSAEMSSQEFTYLVQENWTKRLHEASNLRKAYSEQIKICIEIGLSCVQEDRHKRPAIQDIVDRLNETVAKSTYATIKELLICKGSLGNITQPESICIPNHQQATPSRNEPSPSYNMELNRNTFRNYAQDSNDRHAEQMYRSTFNQDIVSATPSNYFQENAGPREARLDDDSQFYRNDNQEYSADGDPLPGIEGFQIIGDPRPGSNLTACGFPMNGTTLCNFQWVRYLEDGTRQSIEGATMYDYVVTADDVGTLLAVDCTPMDDNGRQGDLVRKFANDENKISCDPDMQNDINICISRGRADFDVYVLGSLGNITQPESICIPNHQQATPPGNDPSSSYNMEPNRNNFHQYAHDRQAEQIYHGSTSNQYAQFKNSTNQSSSPGGIVVKRTTGHQLNPQRGASFGIRAPVGGWTQSHPHQQSAALLHRNIVATAPLNPFEEMTGPRETRLDYDSRNENQEYSADGDSLPGIENFQIVGHPRPASTLSACGIPVNGTINCNFQWVRWLEDGTRQSIEGATIHDYVVTADDVGTLLSVVCTPMDDDGRQATAPLNIVATAPLNRFEQRAGAREARLDDDWRNENQEYSADGDSLPGVQSLQIVGHPTPGSTLSACGFPINGTTLCNFQWARLLDDGTRHSIEGATIYDYVVTADDVGTLLAVLCTPMDDAGRQGDLVTKFANSLNKITCDPHMQKKIDMYIYRGRADFDVYVLPMGYSGDEWKDATLVLTRTRYVINLRQKHVFASLFAKAVIDEKYSPSLETKIPNGHTTQFVLVSSTGVHLPFNTRGITDPNSMDDDVRLRDLIVLVMRTFQKKALLDAEKKGKAGLRCVKQEIPPLEKFC